MERVNCIYNYDAVLFNFDSSEDYHHLFGVKPSLKFETLFMGKKLENSNLILNDSEKNNKEVIKFFDPRDF